MESRLQDGQGLSKVSITLILDCLGGHGLFVGNGFICLHHLFFVCHLNRLFLNHNHHLGNLKRREEGEEEEKEKEEGEEGGGGERKRRKRERRKRNRRRRKRRRKREKEEEEEEEEEEKEGDKEEEDKKEKELCVTTSQGHTPTLSAYLLVCWIPPAVAAGPPAQPACLPPGLWQTATSPDQSHTDASASEPHCRERQTMEAVLLMDSFVPGLATHSLSYRTFHPTVDLGRTVTSLT